MYKYIVAQRAYVDAEGRGKVRFLELGEPISREKPAGKDLEHILTPVNEIAMQVASGKFDVIDSPLEVLKALVELDALDVKAVRDQLKKRKIDVRTNDPDKLIEKIKELRMGQPQKKIIVGVEDDEDVI